MKKPSKPAFACVIYDRAPNGKWSRARELKTPRAVDNLWQKLSKSSSDPK